MTPPRQSLFRDIPPPYSSPILLSHNFLLLFFFNDTATTEIYTLSLHDALPISGHPARPARYRARSDHRRIPPPQDRKSTRLNSSHTVISYAVFCLKKKKEPEAMNSSSKRV